MKRLFWAALTAAILAVCIPDASDAAMQIRKKPTEGGGAEAAPAAEKSAQPAQPSASQAEKTTPKQESPKPAAQAAPAQAKSPQEEAAPIRRESFIGSVSFIQGNKALVECDQTLLPKQRLIVYDERLAKRGVIKLGVSKTKGIYVGTVTAGVAQTGDRVVKETEEEAFRRTFNSKNAATVNEFLELYPDSPHKQEIGLKLFRIALRAEFPIVGGSRITGRVTMAEKVGQKIEAGSVLCRLYHTGEEHLEEASEMVEDAFRISSTAPERRPLILEVVS